MAITLAPQGGSLRIPLPISPDGTFRCESLGRGEYMGEVTFRDEARCYVCPVPPHFEITPGKATRCDFEIEEGVPLRGRIISAKTGQGLSPGRNGGIAVMIKTAAGEWPDNTWSVDGGAWEIYVPRQCEVKVCWGNMPETTKTFTIKYKSPEEIVFVSQKD